MGATPDDDGDHAGPGGTAASTNSVGNTSSSTNNSANLSADNIVLITAGYDHTVKIWHVHTSLCVKTFQHPDSQVNDLAVTPDRRQVACAGFQHIRIYDINSSNQSPAVNFECLNKNITSIGFNNDGTWFHTGGEDCNARIWDLRTNSPQCQKVFQTHSSPVTYTVLHPNNTELIVSDMNGTIHVWDLRNDRTEQLIPDQSSSAPVQCVAVDPKGKFLAAVNNKGDCYVWKLEGSESEPLRLNPFHRMKVHNRFALKCRFSPDSSLLATTSADQTAKVWSAREDDNFKLEAELSCPGQRWVWDAAFTGDSQYLVTASSDNLARLWCLENGQCKREYNGHQKPVTCVDFRDPSI